MIGALWNGISGLNSFEKALSTESNNISNVNTVAYKEDVITFEDLMYESRYGKGVKVEVGEVECSIDANIRVEYGIRIPDVALTVQQKIIKAVTDMTGLKVVEVNVYVQDIFVPKDENDTEEEKKLK